jgi:hypothetical protein
MPYTSSSWLPQSASECTHSASIAPEPVTAAATPLATKMEKLAPKANQTALIEPVSLAMARSLARKEKRLAALAAPQ